MRRRGPTVSGRLRGPGSSMPRRRSARQGGPRRGLPSPDSMVAWPRSIAARREHRAVRSNAGAVDDEVGTHWARRWRSASRRADMPQWRRRRSDESAARSWGSPKAAVPDSGVARVVAATPWRWAGPVRAATTWDRNAAAAGRTEVENGGRAGSQTIPGNGFPPVALPGERAVLIGAQARLEHGTRSRSPASPSGFDPDAPTLAAEFVGLAEDYSAPSAGRRRRWSVRASGHARPSCRSRRSAARPRRTNRPRRG